jgi:hypothetical protein
MLISCPECGKMVSDKSEICIHCGYPIKEYFEEKKMMIEEINKTKCPYCNSSSIDNQGYCNECGMNTIPNKKKGFVDKTADGIMKMIGQEPFEDKKVVEIKSHEKEFRGIYKYGLLGGKKEVYCPRCNSENCSHYKQEHVTPAKTKTSYSLNINPLKPLTTFNKKEKVIRKEQTYTENKIICNNCGYTFY